MDLSLDEEEPSVPSVPLFSSTPRADRGAKFCCAHCGRTYSRKFYFDRHVATHTGQGAVANLNVSAAVQLDLNDISLSKLQDINGNSIVDSSVFKVPAGPAQQRGTKRKAAPNAQNNKNANKRIPHLVCTYCLKRYICSRSYKNHIRTHTIQTLAARFPEKNDILEHSVSIVTEAFSKVAVCPAFGTSGQKFKQLVGHLAGILQNEEWADFSQELCGKLIANIHKKKCLLPSALATILIDDMESLLSDFELCDSIIEKLKLPDYFDNDVKAFFFLELCLYLTPAMLLYVSKTFQENLPERMRARRVVADIDKDDRQVIYYIAGSIMRGYIRIARRYKSSKTWQDVASVLKLKVLVEQPEGDLSQDAEWTMDLNRGGLLFVNSKCQSFFVRLTEVVFNCEKSDGSIPFERVISEVSNTTLCTMWDSIISDSLPESVSINLMNDVVMSFSRTCGRGMAKRRLNFLRKKPVISMPTRHLAATRKNR